jgi:hypothetical protein
MRFTLVTVATLVAAGVLAVATPDNHVIHEAIGPLQGWRKASKLENDVPYLCELASHKAISIGRMRF